MTISGWCWAFSTFVAGPLALRELVWIFQESVKIKWFIALFAYVCATHIVIHSISYIFIVVVCDASLPIIFQPLFLHIYICFYTQLRCNVIFLRAIGFFPYYTQTRDILCPSVLFSERIWQFKTIVLLLVLILICYSPMCVILKREQRCRLWAHT